MKPHKHSELIKLWADGAEIEQACGNGIGEILWHPFKGVWNEYYEYRIKPEPKPDVVKYYGGSYVRNYLKDTGRNENELDGFEKLKLTFDGETGELKSAEVLK